MDGGCPARCSGCGKRVLSGDGNQRDRKNRRRLERFCNRCWRTVVMEHW